MKKILLALALAASVLPSVDAQSQDSPLWSVSRDVSRSAPVDELTGLPYDDMLSRSINAQYAERLGNAGVSYLKVACNPVMESKDGKPTVHPALETLYWPHRYGTSLQFASRTNTQCKLGDVLAIEILRKSCGKSCYYWSSQAYSREQVMWSVVVLQLENALPNMRPMKR